MVPVAGNFISAGQVAALEQDKGIINELALVGLLSPSEARARYDEASTNQM
jgi:hypothetical protein